MDLFSISQLSRFSGIKAHTIRIWEQRYNALTPNRSEGNTRYYDNTQLRRLLNIVSLMDSNYKVSDLCAMPDKKLFTMINEGIQGSKDERTEYFISQLIAAGMSYDESHFEKIFSNCLTRYGLKDAYLKVLYPMLARIGLMWSGDNIPPPNEHFISNILKQKLFSAIDSLPPPKNTGDKWLLFLQENEFHEIGLLFANYMIRLSGRQMVYLGCNVPFDSVVDAARVTKPQYLLFFLVHNELPEITQQFIDNLGNALPNHRVWVACDEKLVSPLKLGKKIKWLSSAAQLEQELT